MNFAIVLLTIVLQMCSHSNSEISLRDGFEYTLQNSGDKLYLTVEDLPSSSTSQGSSNLNLAPVITTEFLNKTNQIWQLTVLKNQENLFRLSPKDYNMIMNTVSAFYELYPVLSSMHLRHILDDSYSIKNLDYGLCLASTSASADQRNRIKYEECNDKSLNQLWIIVQHSSM